MKRPPDNLLAELEKAHASTVSATEKWKLTWLASQLVFDFRIKNPSFPLSRENECLAFAFQCFAMECLVNEADPSKDVNNSQASKYIQDLLSWVQARNLFWGYCSQVLHPEQHEYSGKDDSEAAFWGSIASTKEGASCPDLLDYQASLKSKNDRVFKIFKKVMNSPRRAGRNHPTLDCWLFCVWPIVERYKWRWEDLRRVAVCKFNSERKQPKNIGELDRFAATLSGPYAKSDAMTKHCKLRLGLKITESPRGRVWHFLPTMWQVALQIPCKPSPELFK